MTARRPRRHAFALGSALAVLTSILVAWLVWPPQVEVYARSHPASESAEPSASDSKSKQALAGKWTYRDGDAGRDRVAAAIAEATESLDPLSRKIARDQLRERLAPSSTIQIDFDGDRVEVDLGEGSIIPGELGEWTKWREGGDTYRVHHRLRKTKLTQRLESERTEVRRAFSAKGDRLVLDFRLDDERLGGVVEFSLGYGK